MGLCKYCQKEAGFLKNKHPECEHAFNTGLSEIKKLPAKYKEQGLPFDGIISEAGSIGSKHYINSDKSKLALTESVKELIDTLFCEEIISSGNEQLLRSINSLFPDIDFSELRLRIAKESMIRELLEGNIPSRVRLEGEIPFNLMKDEKVVYIFKNTFSLRATEIIDYSFINSIKIIGKGFYLGKSKFTFYINEDIKMSKYGDLWVTDKNLYFYDGNTRGTKERYSYNDIYFIAPYSNGFIVSNNSNYKTAFITTKDVGWFVYNLSNNLILLKKNEFEADTKKILNKIKNIVVNTKIKSIGEELNMDGWEISAHRAPSDIHAKVQGCIFTNKEYEKLQKGECAVDVDGIKHQITEPIGEGECKHIAYPCLIGISEPSLSKKELSELLLENETGIEVRGRHFTLYQAKVEAVKLKEQIKTETDKTIKADLRSLRKELKEILETKAIRVK